MFPGNVEEPTFILKHVAKAVFLRRPAFPNTEFSASVRDLIIAVLTLSNEMAQRACLERGVEPAKVPGTSVIVPDSQRLAA